MNNIVGVQRFKGSKVQVPQRPRQQVVYLSFCHRRRYLIWWLKGEAQYTGSLKNPEQSRRLTGRSKMTITSTHLMINGQLKPIQTNLKWLRFGSKSSIQNLCFTAINERLLRI